MPLLKLILESTSQLTYNTQDGVRHSGPSRYLKQHTNLRCAQVTAGRTLLWMPQTKKLCPGGTRMLATEWRVFLVQALHLTWACGSGPCFPKNVI